MNITITDIAREKLIEKKIGSENFLRITITKGGCAGFTYDAEIGQSILEGESVLFQDGDIRLVSDDETKQFLDGLTIDYSDDLIAGGLQLTNTKSVSTCGCGSSFNLSGFPVVENDESCCGGKK